MTPNSDWYFEGRRKYMHMGVFWLPFNSLIGFFVFWVFCFFFYLNKGFCLGYGCYSQETVGFLHLPHPYEVEGMRFLLPYPYSAGECLLKPGNETEGQFGYLLVVLPSLWTWAGIQFLAFLCALSDGVTKWGHACEVLFSLSSGT